MAVVAETCCRMGETCFFDVLAIIEHFTAKFVNGEEVIDVGGNVGSALATAPAKSSCVERLLACFGSTDPAFVIINRT
jgi:hypothetical protein